MGLRYGRRFTPGLLTRETQSRWWLTGEPSTTGPPGNLFRGAVALAAKPAGDTWHEVALASVSIGWTPGALRVTTVAAAILALITLVAVAMIPVNPALAGLLLLALLALLALALVVGSAVAAFLVPLLVSLAAGAFVRAKLAEPATRGPLDDAGLLTYAGEGVAEVVARAAVTASAAIPAVPPLVPAAAGTDRFRDGQLEMIIVGPDRCDVLVREV